MAGRSVREATFDVFREYELTSLFANPGSTEIDLLADLPSDLRFVLGLHEGAVVGMATGWAIGRRAPALAILHTTAGLGNAVGALATARVNRAALVVVVGQQDRRHLPSEPFLAGRLRGLAGEYPVWVDEPLRPQDVPGSIARACHEAVTARGPALVIVPMDDWSHEAEDADVRAAPRTVVRARARRPRRGVGARRPRRRGEEPDARRRRRHGRPRHLEGGRRAGGATLVPGVAGALQRARRLPAGPSPLRRAPAGRPHAAARDARAVRRRARRRRAGLPPVPVHPRAVRRAGNPRRGRQRGPGRGAPEHRGAGGARASRAGVRRARAARARARRRAARSARRRPRLPLRPPPASRSAPDTSSPRWPTASPATRS